MKVSELSRRSQVPLPTIKFYIREGLLPAGSRTGRNQAEYSEEHVERLSLIRSLRDEAGLSIAAIGQALRAADTSEDSVQAAIDAIARPSGAAIDEKAKDFRAARDAVKTLAAKLDWELDPKSEALKDAARSLTLLLRSYPEVLQRVPDLVELLRPYWEAVSIIARFEIPDDWQPSEAPNAALRYAVLGTVLGEPLILALRRLAHVARSRELARKAPRPHKTPPGHRA